MLGCDALMSWEFCFSSLYQSFITVCTQLQVSHVLEIVFITCMALLKMYAYLFTCQKYIRCAIEFKPKALNGFSELKKVNP